MVTPLGIVHINSGSIAPVVSVRSASASQAARSEIERTSYQNRDIETPVNRRAEAIRTLYYGKVQHMNYSPSPPIISHVSEGTYARPI